MAKCPAPFPLGAMLRFFCLLALFLLAGCGRIDPPEKLGELVVGVREAAALFQSDEDGASGFDHDLARDFAASLGVKARFVLAADLAELRRLLVSGRIHLAVSLPTDGSDAGGIVHSVPVRKARPVLVRHADALGPDDIDEIAGRTVEVVAGSPQEESLGSLAAEIRPRISAQAGLNDIALLERVANRLSELAASDTLSFRIAANYNPDIDIAFELPGELGFAWGLAADGDPALAARAEEFLRQAARDGTLARVTDRYFGHIRRVNQNGIASLLELMRTQLPHFRREFVAAQEITGIDWRLLAALAYQESRWDPLATSPTGVRGMMMLTEDTADRLRVSNRLDAAQSIRAGARYLADLVEQLPPTVKEPDRTWLALAAYNLGMGHMNGARQFAAGMKRDPDSWYEMKKVLPLLARPEYYRRLKSGRARGGEAVIMVENVRTYYDVISRFEPALKFTLTPFTRR